VRSPGKGVDSLELLQLLSPSEPGRCLQSNTQHPFLTQGHGLKAPTYLTTQTPSDAQARIVAIEF
jgi:hypothetical protein